MVLKNFPKYPQKKKEIDSKFTRKMLKLYFLNFRKKILQAHKIYLNDFSNKYNKLIHF